MPNYVNRVGETIGDLEVQTILRYEKSEPVYGCRCICGAAGVGIKHDAFRKGTARCTSSLHGRPEVRPSATSAISVGSRGNGWAEFYHEQLNQPQPEPAPETVDPYVAKLRAARDEAATAYKRKAVDQWSQYIKHGVAHNWNVAGMIDLKDWLTVPEQYRQDILDKQASGYYEKKKQEAKNAEKL
jgi:hypothetical protein